MSARLTRIAENPLYSCGLPEANNRLNSPYAGSLWGLVNSNSMGVSTGLCTSTGIRNV